ncbi:MAG: Holliday junction branch migration protein RuvA [Propionibacteriaceae bacterium]|jgi:Holliday junction DNA helicase RuvA|nr:Holliday junction branch migration protein RuvA [Propionibacteriaceae bacterium]
MISQLSGHVIGLEATSLVIDVSGVGFQVLSSPATLAGLTLGDSVTLATHLIVREDSLTLYGFDSPQERSAFLLVQSVTGIGPKLALGIVAHLSVSALVAAIRQEDIVSLSKVPGLGKKTAERLILELKEKVTSLGSPPDTSSSPVPSAHHEQVILGLQSLGYNSKDAESAWDSISELTSDPDNSVSDLMKAALKSLARK